MQPVTASPSRLTPAQRHFRAFGRRLTRFVEAWLTRTTITGSENIPLQGPVIFAGNHASTYDAVLIIAHLPEATELVGPGDFKLLFPAEHVIELAGIVRIKRATLDRDSLRLMSGALEAGLNLALFPEGGTWEKRLEDVKPGVAYLSHMHHVPVVPISFGGTYQVWRKLMLLQRPEIHIHFGEPLPPVEIVDRKQRAQALHDYSLMLMRHIYEHLPSEDQARYDNAARARYRAELVADAADTLSDRGMDFSVLAEFASKPNLISPLWRNARLPLKPLARHDRFYPAADFVIAAERLCSALNGEFAGYLNYRLGDEKAAQALDELDALQQFALDAHRSGHKLKFMVSETLVD
ncbi:MAG: 1-acyl-sn-glycerol-3-phosphate acyltransferase [Anaerolineae bacterium]|nr:1-acyl-sn-glycerol-3-phosphate acyltransferase [Anaerolineae bacterium]